MVTTRRSSFRVIHFDSFLTITTLILLLFSWVLIICGADAQTTYDYNAVTVAPYYSGSGVLLDQKQPVACYRCIPRISNDCTVLNSKGVPVLNRKVICDNVGDVCLSAIGVHQHPIGTPEEEAVKKQAGNGNSFRIFTCASESDLRYLNLINNGTQNNCQQGQYENLQLLQLFVPNDRARAQYKNYAIKTCICDSDFCNTEHNHDDKFRPVIIATGDYVRPQDISTTNRPQSDRIVDPYVVPAVIPVAAPTTIRPRTRTTPTTTTQKPSESSIGWLTIFMILCGLLILLCVLFAIFKMIRNRRKKQQANISGGRRAPNGTTVEHDETLLTQTDITTKKTRKNRDSV